MYVDDNGISRFENLDRMAPLQVNLNAALQTVSDAVTNINDRIDNIVEDTGWVNIPLAGGFTVYSGLTPQARQLNNVVYLRGQISGTFPRNSYVSPATSLPVPSPENTMFVATGATNGRVGILGIAANNGGLRFNHDNTSNPTWITIDGISYLVD